jgi:methylthioribose-1-phosphate isomerase
MRTLTWDQEKQELRMIDQRQLPARLEIISCRSYQDVAEAIQNMTIRGAPAIGVAAAFGVVLAACKSKKTNLQDLQEEIQQAATIIISSRPTAVNLSWAVQRIMKIARQPFVMKQDLINSLVTEAQKMANEDIDTNKRIAEHGAGLIQDGDTIIHHCNTGALATVDWGTALGVIRLAHLQGKHLHVLVDETRPRFQGSRLTAWELEQYGISYEIICDNAAGYFLHTRQAQKVFFGADRVAANGDVANKVGSYMLALAAHANNIPVYSVFPTSTVDLNLENGDLIPIEERDSNEVLDIKAHDQPVAPIGAKARNPAFDITPNYLITGLVTEKGLVSPPFQQNLSRVIHE